MSVRSGAALLGVGLALAIASATGAPGDEADVAVPGGRLDGSVATLDLYRDVPARAEPPPGAACQGAQRYVELVNAGRYEEVAELFEEDAVVLEPTRHRTRGRDRIRAFYAGTIGQMKPTVVAVAYLGDDRDCMVELATRRAVDGQPRFALVSIDHFTLGESGKFSRMVAFVRPTGEPVEIDPSALEGVD